MTKDTPKRTKVAFFGHFDQSNWGNEASLQAMMHHLRRRVRDADILCVCTCAVSTRKAYNVDAVPISAYDGRPIVYGRLKRIARKLLIGVPTEPYRWIKAFRELRGTDLFIIPGTGLLTDSFGLMKWGPYNLFKWSVLARLRGSRVLFVSIGTGPLDTTTGRLLAKSALSLADYRSYRDQGSLAYLQQINFPSGDDHVYPDLAFSLPDAILPTEGPGRKTRRVVGVGVMTYTGKYSGSDATEAIRAAYVESLATLVQWLLAHEYDVRLLVGDQTDREVIHQVKGIVKERSPRCDDGRILDEPATSLGQLLSQMAATDMIVATRFHNVLLALLLGKPVVAITFHPKCTSLMRDMGLAEYCHDIHGVKAEELIASVQRLESNAATLKAVIRDAIQCRREVLEEQYSLIFGAGTP